MTPSSDRTEGDVVVDGRGLRCPLPVIHLARAAQGLPPGSRVLVLWTDPAARHDVPAWARLRGHRVLSMAEHPADGSGEEAYATTVEIGPAQSPPTVAPGT